MPLYVYYRVPASQLDAVAQAVQAMQVSLRQQHAGLRCALLRRPELRDGDVTVMETYDGALPDDWEATLNAAAQALPQPRHTERFVSLG